MLVMRAMPLTPEKYRAFCRHGSKNGQGDSDRAIRLECMMCQASMEANCNSQPCQEVKPNKKTEIHIGEPPTAQEPNGKNAGEEWDNNENERNGFLAKLYFRKRVRVRFVHKDLSTVGF
jgi:hypothetical protein